MDKLDNTIFMTPHCSNYYNSDLHRNKLLPKRGISLDKVEEKLTSFHAKLEQTGWMCFSLYPCVSNKH